MAKRVTANQRATARSRTDGPRLMMAPLLAALVTVLLAGCTTRTVGMQAPLAHDYDGMRWYALHQPVVQYILVAPGYTALVGNDPGTEQTDLVDRIERLPDDVRASELEEIRLAVRPAADREFVPALAVQVAVEGESEQAIAAYDHLRYDGDWAIITDLPAGAVAGRMLIVTIEPAPGWEYGLTPDRIPYGGSVATTGPSGAEQRALRGSLGFQTIFAQETDLGEIASLGVESAFPAAVTDPVLLVTFAIIVAGVPIILHARRRRLGTR